MATIQSLVERGSFAIEESSFANLTSDSYTYDGHVYSSKPPALALIDAAVYAPLSWVGISFARDPSWPYFLITLATVGTLSALGLAFFWKTLAEVFRVDAAWATVTTFAAGAGTLVLAFSTVFNSHVIGGSLLFMGFYHAFKHTVHPRPRHAIHAGLLLALAGSIETTCLLFLPFAFLVFLRRSLKDALRYAASCAPLIIFYLGTNLVLSGCLLPSTLNAPLRSSPDSPFSIGNLPGLTSHENVGDALVYAFHVLLGNRGLLSRTPLLVFAVPGTAEVCRAARSERPYREALLLLAASGLFVGLAILRTNNYGGDSFGVRWFATIMLSLCLPIGFVPQDLRGRRWFAAVFWAVSGVSITLALVGSYRPFLPTSGSVPGEPALVDNTIWLAINRLLSLLTLLGRLRFIAVAAVVYTAFFLGKRSYDRSAEGDATEAGQGAPSALLGGE